MPSATANLLTINSGSSSIKYAIYRAGNPVECVLRGAVPCDQGKTLLDWLEDQPAFATVAAIGHRVVHGMKHVGPERITKLLLEELNVIAEFVPEHLPRELAIMEESCKRFPTVPQLACFDTAFHASMPRVAKQIAIPRRFDAEGVQRYGFHGLSYAYLMEELERAAGTAAAHGRVILAHLGSGASLAAVRDRKSVDTSMGFTPASGLVMGTRTGDVDSGLVAYLSRIENLTMAQFDFVANHESGMLGVSGVSADMRVLLECERANPAAAEAVALFCYSARKWIGAFTAVLEGLDTLVFSGGIGENAAPVRARICEPLKYLGVEIDAAANASHAAVISTPGSRVTVRVMRTDEELMIARCVSRMLIPQ